ncbi:heterokaryon incompatibility 6 OR allele [Fusarium beomiforme]|uniref:Heterokaryon incompatibility 6 OR allele n=1 Tax=Fusarium beomiforme TaxID=44412 RepID=A0A9P5AF74_9HYPO|nr:heterokaryon incompatibility 6 OR allele [Fusarium beomiforme]
MSYNGGESSQSGITLMPLPTGQDKHLQFPDSVISDSEDDQPFVRPRSETLYDKLPLNSPSAVRVLDLQDCPTQEDEPLTATMRVVDLDTRPFFTALSYVWGEWSTPADMIYCNGHGVRVTKNCLSALRHLNKLGPITIWIDAICINQNNPDDKNKQIPLMATIYSSLGAHSVYVWLGEGTKNTAKAMDYLACGCLPFRFLITKKDGLSWGGSIPTGISMSLRLGLHLYLRCLTWRFNPCNQALQELLDRPWIKRVWTMQEALLAERLILVCGHRAISFHALLYSMEFMAFFRGKELALQFPSALHRWHRLINVVLVIAALSSRPKHQHEPVYPYREAEALLLEIQDRRSLYAKDKYFTTSSLLKQGQLGHLALHFTSENAQSAIMGD